MGENSELHRDLLTLPASDLGRNLLLGAEALEDFLFGFYAWKFNRKHGIVRPGGRYDDDENELASSSETVETSSSSVEGSGSKSGRRASS